MTAKTMICTLCHGTGQITRSSGRLGRIVSDETFTRAWKENGWRVVPVAKALRMSAPAVSRRAKELGLMVTEIVRGRKSRGTRLWDPGKLRLAIRKTGGDAKDLAVLLGVSVEDAAEIVAQFGMPEGPAA